MGSEIVSFVIQTALKLLIVLPHLPEPLRLQGNCTSEPAVLKQTGRASLGGGISVMAWWQWRAGIADALESEAG